MKLNSLRMVFVALAILAMAVPALVPPSHASASENQEGRATLLQYSKETDLKALAAGEGKTVVFFFAGWCPNCILTVTELSQKWAEVEPDITLVIADYDTETELKAEYGVTYQDTFVLLDKEAKSAKLWNAGGIAGLNANTR